MRLWLCGCSNVRMWGGRGGTGVSAHTGSLAQVRARVRAYARVRVRVCVCERVRAHMFAAYCMPPWPNAVRTSAPSVSLFTNQADQRCHFSCWLYHSFQGITPVH